MRAHPCSHPCELMAPTRAYPKGGSTAVPLRCMSETQSETSETAAPLLVRARRCPKSQDQDDNQARSGITIRVYHTILCLCWIGIEWHVTRGCAVACEHACPCGEEEVWKKQNNNKKKKQTERWWCRSCASATGTRRRRTSRGAATLRRVLRWRRSCCRPKSASMRRARSRGSTCHACQVRPCSCVSVCCSVVLAAKSGQTPWEQHVIRQVCLCWRCILQLVEQLAGSFILMRTACV